jgi:hypothetical protein
VSRWVEQVGFMGERCVHVSINRTWSYDTEGGGQVCRYVHSHTSTPRPPPLPFAISPVHTPSPFTPAFCSHLRGFWSNSEIDSRIHTMLIHTPLPVHTCSSMRRFSGLRSRYRIDCLWM